MADYILALDQGTTGSRCILYDSNAVPLLASSREFTQYYPQPGWVEHDAEELFQCQLDVMKDVVKKAEQSLGIAASDIAAAGITNQRETVVLWEKETGKPVHRAIVWQCRRTAPLCEKLRSEGLNEVMREKTGLLLDAYFSATKIKWLLDNVDGLRRRAENGEILAGTIDTWLIWKLSGGKSHVTDVTNASRTMLYNIYAGGWDPDLLKLMDIPECMMPRVANSSEIYCSTDAAVCGFSIPLASAVGDQQAALFGQGCFYPGDVKNTYGTGCFMLMNTGTKPVVSKNKLLTTIALGINDEVQYALEGSIFMGGATIKWLRDELELISSAPEIDRLAESVEDSNGAYIVPAFTGLGTPYWDMYARGTIIGLTRGVKKAHICRAVLEAICYQVKDVIDCMEEDAGQRVTSLKVDGGASVSDVMLQFQADIMNTKVSRPKNVETTALGAAFLAGLAVGLWKDKADILAHRQIDRDFTPAMSEEKREALYRGWQRAVERSRGWIEK
ncbi:glycerol kinase GlpK [Treponema sp. OMZ 840]|uniref:glycerol kinase GlpK n=1 Tax=Treponema sp. OMZ 840 TaxID=244313 RepID=UPI003D91DB96